MSCYRQSDLLLGIAVLSSEVDDVTQAIGKVVRRYCPPAPEYKHENVISEWLRYTFRGIFANMALLLAFLHWRAIVSSGLVSRSVLAADGVKAL